MDINNLLNEDFIDDSLKNSTISTNSSNDTDYENNETNEDSETIENIEVLGNIPESFIKEFLNS